MKRSCAYIALLNLCLINASCEKDWVNEIEVPSKAPRPRYSYFHVFSLSDYDVAPFSKSSQGMDIFEDRILFQAGIEDNCIYVLDLNSRKCLKTVFFLTPDGDYSHMNNINCGERFTIHDDYPILYISQTTSPHACFVIRLLDTNDSYELIQTIKYIGTLHHANSNYDWFIDLPNRFIYTYGKINGAVTDREIVKFSLPDLDGQEVLFTDDDVIDCFVLDNMSIYQGSRIINGLLYAPVGYGTTQYPGYLKIIDLNEKKLVKDIPIDCGEPEAIGKFRDGAIISSCGRIPKYYYIQL